MKSCLVIIFWLLIAAACFYFGPVMRQQSVNLREEGEKLTAAPEPKTLYVAPYQLQRADGTTVMTTFKKSPSLPPSAEDREAGEWKLAQADGYDFLADVLHRGGAVPLLFAALAALCLRGNRFYTLMAILAIAGCFYGAPLVVAEGERIRADAAVGMQKAFADQYVAHFGPRAEHGRLRLRELGRLPDEPPPAAVEAASVVRRGNTIIQAADYVLYAGFGMEGLAAVLAVSSLLLPRKEKSDERSSAT